MLVGSSICHGILRFSACASGDAACMPGSRLNTDRPYDIEDMPGSRCFQRSSTGQDGSDTRAPNIPLCLPPRMTFQDDGAEQETSESIEDLCEHEDLPECSSEGRVRSYSNNVCIVKCTCRHWSQVISFQPRLRSIPKIVAAACRFPALHAASSRFVYDHCLPGNGNCARLMSPVAGELSRCVCSRIIAMASVVHVEDMTDLIDSTQAIIKERDLGSRRQLNQNLAKWLNLFMNHVLSAQACTCNTLPYNPR